MKLKGGQKHKIDNIEGNNEVRVLQLHQYVLQVGRRNKQFLLMFMCIAYKFFTLKKKSLAL